jgi:hypothetical protein
VHPEAAAFTSLVERYLDGDYDAGADDDPAYRLDIAAERGTLQAAALLRRALVEIDTSSLSTEQRVDWLLLEARANRVFLDTVLHRGERVPNRYVPLGGLYWRVAGDAVPDDDDWAWAAEQLEAAPAVLAVGRRRVRAPPPLWTELAVANARGTAAFLDGDLLGRLGEAPDSLRPRLTTAAATARDALLAYATFLTDTLEQGANGSSRARRYQGRPRLPRKDDRFLQVLARARRGDAGAAS